MARRAEDGRSEERGVYIISVAAELAGVHPQTLRIYERKGLLSPSRTAGNTRRYSERDIERLQSIQRLTQEFGVNLAGVKMIVEMENELDRMRRKVEQMARELERARLAAAERARLREEAETAMVPMSSVRRFSWEIRS
jgi:MerR family transcriptional regulator, heat shock protein HspR